MSRKVVEQLREIRAASSDAAAEIVHTAHNVAERVSNVGGQVIDTVENRLEDVVEVLPTLPAGPSLQTPQPRVVKRGGDGLFRVNMLMETRRTYEPGYDPKGCLMSKAQERLLLRGLFYTFAFIGILFLILSFVLQLGVGQASQAAIWALSATFLGGALSLNTRVPLKEPSRCVGIAGIVITVCTFIAFIFFCIGANNRDLDKLGMGLGIFVTCLGSLASAMWTYNLWFPSKRASRIAYDQDQEALGAFKSDAVQEQGTLAQVESGTPDNIRKLHVACNVLTIILWYIFAILIIFFTFDIRNLVGDAVKFAPPTDDRVPVINVTIPHIPPPAPPLNDTDAPTFARTLDPTASPSISPSSGPTVSAPTRSPSTEKPTRTPTFTPSEAPSFSTPTRSPSNAPASSAPSKSPATSVPTKSPSTSKPSTSPSRSPTSSTPTESPTSSLPTASPSSSTPTSSPHSSAPTHSPATPAPSAGPTSTKPTKSPSQGATEVPTSQRPTKSPSTTKPSASPTVSPTKRPTSLSPTSKTPTRSPSASPTKKPTSKAPTRSPSLSPTLRPTSKTPSRSPSRSPTVKPSTLTPTLFPTTSPTLRPTSVAPTREPSRSPTIQPSTRTPSRTPTRSPTFSPTTTFPPMPAPPPTLPPGTPGADGSLHMQCEGDPTAKPVVILEHTVGATLDIWAWVQDRLSNFTYVCAYSRRGYGFSSPGNLPRTPQWAALELKAAMDQRGITSPVVFAAHGLGGFNMRYFYQLFPSRVAAMVFVDSVSPECFKKGCDSKLQKADEDGYATLESLIPTGIPRALAYAGTSYPGPAGICVATLPIAWGSKKVPARDRLLAALLAPALWGNSQLEDRDSPTACALAAQGPGNSDSNKISVPLMNIIAENGIYKDDKKCGREINKAGGGKYPGKSFKTSSTSVEIAGANHFSILCDRIYANQVADNILTMVTMVRDDAKTYVVKTGTKLTWQAAKAACEAQQQRLALVKTTNNAEYLDSLDAFDAANHDDDMWIGATDLASPGTYKWLDGSLVSSGYNYYASHEPTNGAGEDCVDIGRSNRKWRDRACSETKYYLCEQSDL